MRRRSATTTLHLAIHEDTTTWADRCGAVLEPVGMTRTCSIADPREARCWRCGRSHRMSTDHTRRGRQAFDVTRERIRRSSQGGCASCATEPVDS